MKQNDDILIKRDEIHEYLLTQAQIISTQI